MLNEKIKSLRKGRGMTQEELAIKLNVVRQTISKWEKSQSVPDAELLIRIAEVFEITVSELLGGDSENRAESSPNNDLAQQLERINEHLAVRNKRFSKFWKIVLGVVIAILVLQSLMVIVGMVSYRGMMTETEVTAHNYEEINPSD